YDAAQLDAERAAAAKARKTSKLRDDLLKKMSSKDPGDWADDSDATAPTKPPVQPVVAKPDEAPTPSPVATKQPWKPQYTCRLADGTVLTVEDPQTMSGYAVEHPPECHLTNGEAMLGLSGNGDFSDLKIDKNR